MKKLNDLVARVNKRIPLFDIDKIKKFTKNFGTEEYLFVNGGYGQGSTEYLKWIYCLAQEVNPKKVVELGAYTGVSTLMFLAGMSKDSTLLSVDINPNSWSLVPKDKRLVKVVGDDVGDDLKLPRGKDLKDADIWFIDSDHTGEHFNREIEKYSLLWKKGTIVIVDDVSYPQFSDYSEAWNALSYTKRNLSELHYTGFGIFIV